MWLAWSWYGYSAVTCLQKRYYLLNRAGLLGAVSNDEDHADHDNLSQAQVGSYD